MVTQFRAPANTQLASSTGGTIAVAEEQDIVVKWAKALETWETPALTKMMSDETVSNPVHQWGQSKKIRYDTTLQTGVNNAVTDIVVAAGDGLIFQAQAMISIVDYKTGSTTDLDESTRENLWVKSISTDTLTVDTRGVFSTASAHVAGALIQFVGTAEPENGEHAEAPRQRGFRLFNYPMRFNAKLTADKRYQNTATWEHPTGNPHLEDFATEMRKQKELLERWAFIGTRYAGSADPSAPRPSTFGGLNSFLTTNVVNLGGQMLLPGELDLIMREIWHDLGASQAKTWVMGMDESVIMDTSINPIRRATATDTTLNTTVNTYKTRMGNIDIVPMRNIPRGNLYLVDWSLIKVKPYKGLNWHKSRKNGAEHAVDNDVDAISGDFTLEVESEHAMARIYNFDMNLDNYPQPDFY